MAPPPNKADWLQSLFKRGRTVIQALDAGVAPNEAQLSKLVHSYVGALTQDGAIVYPPGDDDESLWIAKNDTTGGFNLLVGMGGDALFTIAPGKSFIFAGSGDTLEGYEFASETLSDLSAIHFKASVSPVIDQAAMTGSPSTSVDGHTWTIGLQSAHLGSTGPANGGGAIVNFGSAVSADEGNAAGGGLTLNLGTAVNGGVPGLVDLVSPDTLRIILRGRGNAGKEWRLYDDRLEVDKVITKAHAPVVDMHFYDSGNPAIFNAAIASTFNLAINDTAAWSVGIPTNPTDGQRIIIRIQNGSGSALGAATWNAIFQMGTWTNPASGKVRTIEFVYVSALTKWTQVGSISPDL